MKISVSWAACGAMMLLLSVSGCANIERFINPVSQKKPASQTTNQQAYAHDSGPASGQPYSAAPVIVPHMPPAPVPPSLTSAKVAILLPLSGANAGLGQAMLNAAQQAVFDAAGTNFQLLPHDTAAAGGAEAAARAAASEGAQLIIGPLFATDVPAVLAVAQGSGISVLTLSTDAALTQRGVYVMGLAPGPQVARVVAYAAAHGARRFAALVPNTPYGSLVGGAFQTAVAQNGGTVVDYETFDATAASLTSHAKAIAGQRATIDALFLPEAGANLKSIADQLAAAGMDSHVHLLGTGLWDVPDLGTQSALLNGGWYAAPDPAARQTFIANYSSAYGQQPPRLATLAYDATALAAVLAKRGSRYDEVSLTNPNGFAGLDGIFRLTASGTVERGLAVDEVTPEGARVVDPAPVSFVGNAR
ncbi:MAG: penicillin-binding protein activator [Alphaproteobacteria bacterium]|nr:penicillin-binding protein activator [Alphaproteobacteria bacterium]